MSIPSQSYSKRPFLSKTSIDRRLPCGVIEITRHVDLDVLERSASAVGTDHTEVVSRMNSARVSMIRTKKPDDFGLAGVTGKRVRRPSSLRSRLNAA